MLNFIYFRDIEQIPIISNERKLLIHKNIEDERELFDFYLKGFEFPYFGKNWDALWDCMCDLTWLNERKLKIVHADIPFNHDLKQRKIYIDILADLATMYKNDPDYSLEIYFPIEFKEELEKLKQEIDEGKSKNVNYNPYQE